MSTAAAILGPGASSSYPRQRNTSQHLLAQLLQSVVKVSLTYTRHIDVSMHVTAPAWQHRSTVPLMNGLSCNQVKQFSYYWA